MSYRRRLLPLRRFFRELVVVSRWRRHKHALGTFSPATDQLSNSAHQVVPVKHLHGEFSFALTDRMASPASFALIDSQTNCVCVVLCEVSVIRLLLHVAARRAGSASVSAAAPPSAVPTVGSHQMCIGRKFVPLIRGHGPHVATYCAGVATLAEQRPLTAPARFMRFVAALLAVSVFARANVATWCMAIGGVFAQEASMLRLRLNLRAIVADALAQEVVSRMHHHNGLV